MGRHFTLAEAERLLPLVEKLLRKAIEARLAYQQADQELTSLIRDLHLAGGKVFQPASAIEIKSKRETSAAILKDAIEEVHEHGCQVKDLDTGLVDFPTYYRGREVLLCWKLGESAIEHWHGVEEGYRGRKPIDQDFLENHSGDRTQ